MVDRFLSKLGNQIGELGIGLEVILPGGRGILLGGRVPTARITFRW
jgi:hypothetical protein